MTSINTNILAGRAQSAVLRSGVEIAKHMQKLSTGKAVNIASDSASGVAMISRMSSQIMGASQALRNVQDGISIAQTADGALGEMASMTQRMRELSVQSLNDTLAPQDRDLLDLEFQAIKRQMLSVTQQTTWNKIPILQPRNQVLERIVPAQLGGQAAIDTSAPVDGSYQLFINGQAITLDLIQGEPALQRLNKITAAVNAGTATHGAVASVNAQGAIDLRTPDGRDLAAAYNTASGAMTGIHLGLGVPSQAQVNQLTVTAGNSPYPVLTQGNGYLQMSGHGGSGETMAWPNLAQPLTQAQQFSMVNGSLYRGNGTGATVVGTVDNVLNGIAGQPLRINLPVAFVNGSFEATSSGAITGWTVEQRMVRLNGQDTIAGFPVPADNTVPAGSSGESATVMGGSFTASLTGATASNGGQSVMMEISNALVSPYGVAHGPALVSNTPVAIPAGQTVSFDWKAEQGSDKYDVYAYMLNVDNGSTQELLNTSGTFTDWTTRSVAVSAAGNYKFVFVAGAFDATGGMALGAKMYVDNIRTGNDPFPTALTSADLDALESQIVYTDQTPFSVSVSINDVPFNSDPSLSATAAWDSLLQKIAAQTDARMANVQVAKLGDALTIRSTQPGQAFTVSSLSSTSQVNAVRNDVLTPNRSVGDAISAIQNLSELANIAVVQGVSVGPQELEAGKFLKIHLGANQGQTLDLELPDYGTPGGRIDALVWDAALPDGPNAQTPGRTVIHIRNAAAAGQAMVEVDTTLAAVLTDRARLGAVMNRLSYAGDNLSQMQTELSKSRSVIEDTNYATSASSLIKNQILNQASMAVLTQANTQPEMVLELLRTQG